MSEEETKTWNALYLEWLQEMLDAVKDNIARQHQQITYQRAIKSLESCPKAFVHPSQLQELRYIGPKLCSMLENKTKKYCKAKGIEMPEDPKRVASFVSPSNETTKASKTNSRTQRTRQYVPRYRSGGYAILLALRKNERRTKRGEGMTKAPLIDMARDFCDSEFEANPNAGTYYSAWNSVNSLIKHDLVYASKTRFSTYYLTDTGREIADRLRDVAKEKAPAQVSQMWSSPINSDANNSTATGGATSSPLSRSEDTSAGGASFTTSYWPPGTYSVKLVVDNREVRMSTDENLLQKECEREGISVELAPLAVGDALWVAENRETRTKAVIDHIVERKRLDDLIRSIQDNRFTEQKFRLHRSSLKNVVYLIELPIGMSCPAQNRKMVQTSMSQVMVSDGFFLKRTLSAQETIRYLIATTKYLERKFKHSPLTIIHPRVKTYRQSMADAREVHKGTVGINYEHFSNALSKSGLLTVRDVFIKMLMTIRGITWDKAVEIQRIYPTPYHLWQTYDTLDNVDAKKQLLFKATGTNISRRRISKLLSERVYEIWGDQSPSSTTTN